jgi:ribosomal protein S18 acetylase RimI-like enzyme
VVTVRPATPADAAALAACVEAVARERRYLASTEGFGLDATRAFIEMVARRGGVHLLAVTDAGDIVGWCDIVPPPFEGMSHAGHLGIGVLSGWRGQGHGRRLLREAVAAATARGIERVELEVFASNWAARRLYETEGFEVEGWKRGARRLDGREDDLVLMSRRASEVAARGRVPAPIGSPVLASVGPVVAASRHVRTNVPKLVEHAAWLAYEELPLPSFGPAFDPATRRADLIDFVMVTTCINTAFTSFETGEIFSTEIDGRRWFDAEAMMACVRRALAAGVPVLEGRWLAGVSRRDLLDVFAGDIEMPMLDEKRAILNDVGRVLVARYDGRFHHFLEDCPPRLYDDGRGLLERLVREFPRFDDVSACRGYEVRFYKLAQLAFWILSCTLRDHGGLRLDDIETMTAFADYIVPMALRAMGILEYSPELDAAIAGRRLIPRDSEEEVEIRAHTIFATALLREEINERRPRDRQVIIPQIDARLWQGFHATPQAHHLTRTIMY